jgi:hypothetical protein
MEKIKCVDCGLWFKDRERYGEEHPDSLGYPKSCFNCAFIRNTMDICALSIGNQQNRKVIVNLTIEKL